LSAVEEQASAATGTDSANIQRVREHGDQSYLHHRQTRRCRGMSIGKYSMPDC